MISRNLGIISAEEQKKLNESSVAIAGVGGVGGLLAERLIRIGIGKLKLTDPGMFEVSNLNRQYASHSKNLNESKASIIAADLQRINPQAIIEFDMKGISSQDDADNFVSGVSLVADEMDFGLFKESIYLHRAARHKGMYYMFSVALGFGALVATFDPNGITLEEYNGLKAGCDLENAPEIRLPFDKISSYFPSYMKGKEELINEILEGKMAVSSNSIGAGLAAIITSNEIVNILLNKTVLIKAPRCFFIDLMDKVLTV